MDRREFVAAGLGGTLALSESDPQGLPSWPLKQGSIRDAFPRLREEVFLNAAGGTPLGSFSEEGLRRYMDFARLGPDREYVQEMLRTIRTVFGDLIGARPNELALVHCTKDGEQIVLDGLDPMRTGRNVVTNDMHFTGSLHNYEGLRRAGMDVRIVRGMEWDVSLDAMESAIDDDTALVAVTLLSNVTGRIEPVRRLAEIAHGHGAYLYADIIQAAGIVPLAMRDLGIDFAACSGYKWLYGVHGVGFLYVREELQGDGLPDRLFPGHIRYNYAPWVRQPDAAAESFLYTAPTDASRYQPGHVSYLGYCGLYEGLKFLRRFGVENALAHSVRLNATVRGRLDATPYRCITPVEHRTPIISFVVPDPDAVARRLRGSGIVVSFADHVMRVSPAVYNTDEDVERLLTALAA